MQQGTSLHWDTGSGPAQSCKGNYITRHTATCDNTAFSDAVSVTKRSYEKIGDAWYLAEADIVFDEAHNWQIYSGPLQHNVEDFHRVIVHELGHASGLDPPDDAGQTVTAIMNSQISGIDSLQQDDKDGIIYLYSGIIGNGNNQAGSSSGG